jgi:8-amino-7-oxononanoate synthase
MSDKTKTTTDAAREELLVSDVLLAASVPITTPPPIASPTAALRGLLADLERSGLRRNRRIVDGTQTPHLLRDGVPCLSFCSNDYLGLASHPAIVEAAVEGARRFGVGATASHLINGHMRAHEELEHALARFVRMPRALLFSTGYMANLGVIPALVGRGDLVLSDSLNHACIIDSARLSRAEVHVYPHGDAEAVEHALAAAPPGTRKLVATDAVFSMDGDLAPLDQLLAACERYGAWLLVDDAHGFGVLGSQGRGSANHYGLRSDNLVYMGTLGKAAGVAGAFVAGCADLIEWLVQRARTHVFTTASPPMLAVALLAALRLIETDEWRREHLRALVTQLREGLGESGRLRLMPSDTAIQPLLVGDNDAALRVSQSLLARGIWVPAIRPPTVPDNTARLRISLSASHTAHDVAQLVAALQEECRT